MLRALAVALLAAAAPMAVSADVLDRIGERGAIRLGVRTDTPPFSFAGPDGAPAGLAVRLCREVATLIAGRLGRESLEIEYVPVTALDRFPALIEGRTDLHCGPASTTLGRRETLDFSLLYFVDGAGAAVRPGVFETVFDRRAGRLGYLAGTTTAAVVMDLIARNGLDAETVEFADHAAGLAALDAGRLDIYFGDQAILLFQIEKLGLADRIAVMEEIFSFEPYALAMKRGESRLRLEVDRALSAIYERGLIHDIILEELGDYPLPPETRAVYQIVGLPE